MPPASDHPAQLFSDAELEPVELVRRRDETGQFWVCRCRKCGLGLAWAHGQDEARQAGLTGLGGHVCVGPGELPEGF